MKEMHVASEANPQWIPQCAVVCMICISAVLENAYIPGNLTYILLAETLSALFPAVSRGFIVSIGCAIFGGAIYQPVVKVLATELQG